MPISSFYKCYDRGMFVARRKTGFQLKDDFTLLLTDLIILTCPFELDRKRILTVTADELENYAANRWNVNALELFKMAMLSLLAGVYKDTSYTKYGLLGAYKSITDLLLPILTDKPKRKPVLGDIVSISKFHEFNPGAEQTIKKIFQAPCILFINWSCKTEKIGAGGFEIIYKSIFKTRSQYKSLSELHKAFFDRCRLFTRLYLAKFQDKK